MSPIREVGSQEKAGARRAYMRQYLIDNRERLRGARKSATKKWQLANKEYCKERARRYNQRPEIKARRNEYLRNQRKQNHPERLRQNLRRRITGALRGECKAAHTIELLGCSIESLVERLEGLFLPGMTWGNYGRNGWHIDHITPLVSFDLSDPAQQFAACHYANLQPLWAWDNQSKQAKVHWGAA